jgi:multimeric flavodoxin WrbA
MTIIAILGSPRKDWITATPLGKALQGAAQWVKTTRIRRHDLSCKECRRRLARKTHRGGRYGTCPIDDDVLPTLKQNTCGIKDAGDLRL